MLNPDVLVKYQKKKRLTGAEICKALGKHPTWFSKVTTGKSQLRAEYIMPLSEMFGVKPETLVKEYFLSPKVEKISTD